MDSSCAGVPAIAGDSHGSEHFGEGQFEQHTWYPRPKALLALPLLGIPGVCAENEDPAYYDDSVQFRPPPAE
ncbi:MAG: DUF3025 domain-containing protein [Burkholderiales bacterium]|nr:DUF3025 domain-containing protein [Burkholderiales bacterium]